MRLNALTPQVPPDPSPDPTSDLEPCNCVADDPTAAAKIHHQSTSHVPPLMHGGVTRAQESQGDEIPEEGCFSYAFSLQTWKTRNDPRPIITEEVFHMLSHSSPSPSPSPSPHATPNPNPYHRTPILIPDPTPIPDPDH